MIETANTEQRERIGTLFQELTKLYPELCYMSEYEYLWFKDWRGENQFYINYSGDQDPIFTYGYESIIIGNCTKLLPGYYWKQVRDGDEIKYAVLNAHEVLKVEKSSNLCLALLRALKLKA